MEIEGEKDKVKNPCLLTRANQTSSATLFSHFFFFPSIHIDEHFLRLILTMLLYFIYICTPSIYIQGEINGEMHFISYLL